MIGLGTILAGLKVGSKAAMTLAKILPRDPDKGPPLPGGLGVDWPDLLKKGVESLTKR